MSADTQMQHQNELLKHTLADAMRFWESRRVLYNVILFAIVVAWFILTWPHFRPALTWFAFVRFAFLGVLANLCYCAAYVVDLPMRSSELGAAWAGKCWVLWSLGTLFAIVLENYWIADEIYPYVR